MIKNKSLTIKKYVSSLSSVKKSSAENSLGSVLSLVKSSHEAVFIFDDKDEFIGLISPFKTLYSRNYPHTTKVSSIVYKPPFITEDTPVYQLAKYMLSSKIYMLPVFNKEKVLQGVVYGRDVLKGVIKKLDLLEFVSNKIKPRKPTTAHITSSVKDVFYDLKKKGVSRMIVVNDEGHLAGIVTRSDLMHTLIKPTSKLRFPKEGAHVGYYSLAGEKSFRKNEPIRKYSTTLVDSLSNDVPKTKIVKHLINSKHDSIVLVDKYKKPTGFISTRDLLKVFAFLRPEENVPLVIRKPSKEVSSSELKQATTHLEVFGKKLKKRIEIERIEVKSEELKNTKGDTTLFKITVIVTPVKGKSLVAVSKNRKFIDGIQEVTKVIEKQRKRTGLSKDGAKIR